MAGRRRFAAGGIALCLRNNLRELDGAPVERVEFQGSQVKVIMREGPSYFFSLHYAEERSEVRA